MIEIQPTIAQILKNMHIKQLNPMQVATIEACDVAQDTIVISPTGSGKTLGFLIPVFKYLDPQILDVQALVIVPSRELALQIEQVFKSMKTGFKVNCCYGGHEMAVEENNLSQPPALLIGTPGRISDHISRQNIQLNHIKIFVLDEFDKSLEMGFQEEMAFISKSLKNIEKRILTSATETVLIPDFTGVGKNPTKLNFITQSDSKLILKTLTNEGNDSKLETLYKLLCHIGKDSVIIFCNQRDEVEEVSKYLTSERIINNNFHGGLEQNYRESTLIKFRNGSNNVLVTTDLAARGLDIPEVKYVVHFQIPPKEDAFVHRNGRTARQTASGTALIMLKKDDFLPDYVKSTPEKMILTNKNNLHEKPEWETLFLGGGKKDKINIIDIVGFLSKVGGLTKDELGLIEVKDKNAYAAVKRNKIQALVEKVRYEKIKGVKIKIEIARDNPKVDL
ncbi:MAG: DEAD/DEAH box helicase [Cytophagales bacterium]|nr:MAG: DEAD/DEAH box helicase [Cytophagales bacterium]